MGFNNLLFHVDCLYVIEHVGGFKNTTGLWQCVLKFSVGLWVILLLQDDCSALNTSRCTLPALGFPRRYMEGQEIQEISKVYRIDCPDYIVCQSIGEVFRYFTG